MQTFAHFLHNASKLFLMILRFDNLNNSNNLILRNILADNNVALDSIDSGSIQIKPVNRYKLAKLRTQLNRQGLNILTDL